MKPGQGWRLEHYERVIDAARAVWEGLGVNAYWVQFRARPVTWRGYLEGRAWLLAGALGTTFLVFASAAAQDASAIPWVLFVPLIIAWPVLVVLAFRRRYRSLAQRGGKELPHLNQP